MANYNQFVLDEAAKRIVANAIASGKININTTEEVDVRGYATAQANGENVLPDNIRKGVTILGVSGDFGEALTFSIIAGGCNVTIYRWIDTEWVNISQGREDGEIALGASYRITVTANAGSTVEVFKCNGVDLAITSDVETATTVLADPDLGLQVLAVASGSGSSSDIG